MLQGLYQRVLALAASRNAPWWLALVSFAESSFFPIPPDVLLIPMALARPHRAWTLAAICTAASVAGGAAGYAIGYLLFDQLATPLLHAYGYEAAFARFQATYAQYGLWVILIKGFTPVPYFLVTMASGIAHFSLAMFVGASIVTRGGRFFLEAALLQHPHAKAIIDRHLNLIAPAAVVLLIAALLAVRAMEGHHP